MAELSIAERVANGVKYLDEYVPDWVGRITLPELDMRSDCSCVIGQVVGTYDAILTDGWGDAEGVRLITSREAAECGFDSLGRVADARGSFDERFTEEFDALQAEWERVINERRAVSR